MKKGIHPEVHDIEVTCACGKSYTTRSVASELKVTLCAACHPFYTGASKFVDTAGKIEKFYKKFKNSKMA